MANTVHEYGGASHERDLAHRATAPAPALEPARPAPPALRRQVALIVGSYAVVATLWISLSDRLLGWWAGHDPALLLRLSELKGIGFVLTTAGLLWLLLRRALRTTETTLLELQRKESERFSAEQALRELNQSLEAKVARRTSDLEAARQRAEAADRTKSAFLATMSHELRTPLNSIIGFTGILAQELAGPLNGEQKKQLDMVQSSARHLLSLINDVLDISKIEAGQVEIRRVRFDLVASVEEVVASVEPLAVRKSLFLRVTAPRPPVVMTSDPRRVQQVLMNLVSNAIKFTESGGVTVAITPLQASPDADSAHVRVCVSDTGIGIDREGVEQLFQPFRQLDSGLHRQREGTGLGLAICHRLTSLLGGTVGVESRPGHGSSFTVELPLVAPQPEPA